MTWKAIDESETLAHYGVLGMKWGVRNAETQRKYASQKTNKSPFEKRVVKTSSGEKLTMERVHGGAAAKLLGRVSPAIKNEQEKTYMYKVRDSNKKQVGDFHMYQKPDGEMNIVWGSVKNRYRDRGYMTAVTAEGERIAKELGNVKITAELVGNSPGNSIHKLANKAGYIKVGENKTQEVLETWGGLTYVEKRLR